MNPNLNDFSQSLLRYGEKKSNKNKSIGIKKKKLYQS